MYNFLGKGGYRSAVNRRRKRGLRLILFILTCAAAIIILRLTCGSHFPQGRVMEGVDISDSIFGTSPREDRPLRHRLPLNKSAIDELNRDDKLKAAGPKRIPPHPILEIIGPDGKTLLKKK